MLKNVNAKDTMNNKGSNSIKLEKRKHKTKN